MGSVSTGGYYDVDHNAYVMSEPLRREWEDPSKAAGLPAAALALVKGERPQPAGQNVTTRRPADNELNRRIAAYVQKAGNRADGEGRNNTAFQIAAWLRRDMACDDATALHWLKLWNEGNSPPLPERELRSCYESGLSHGTSPIGAALVDTRPPSVNPAPPTRELQDAYGIQSPADAEKSRALGKVSRRIVLTSEEELEALQPMQFAVEGILPEKGLGLLFGASESFKSFLALYIAFCIRTGRSFHGHAVQPGSVFYVAAEGFFGMQPRYRALKEHFGMTGSNRIHFLRHGIDVRQGSRDVQEVIDALAELNMPISYIFLDTLNRNFSGNENAPDDMGAYLKGCDQLREATGAGVLSIHHTGHVEAERGRGHSSLRAALDVELKCVRDGDDRVTLECTKMKDAPHFISMKFDMVKEGPSLVPNEVGTADVKMTRNRATALEALPLEGGMTRKQWETASGLKPGTFRHALDWFTAMSYVRQSRDGKYTRNEAGQQALVPHCQSAATGVPHARPTVPATQGGI